MAAAAAPAAAAAAAAAGGPGRGGGCQPSPLSLSSSGWWGRGGRREGGWSVEGGGRLLLLPSPLTLSGSEGGRERERERESCGSPLSSPLLWLRKEKRKERPFSLFEAQLLGPPPSPLSLPHPMQSRKKTGRRRRGKSGHAGRGVPPSSPVRRCFPRHAFSSPSVGWVRRGEGEEEEEEEEGGREVKGKRRGWRKHSVREGKANIDIVSQGVLSLWESTIRTASVTIFFFPSSCPSSFLPSFLPERQLEAAPLPPRRRRGPGK